MLKLSILVPAYNEEATILEILELVKKSATPGVEKEVIVVDDGSTDATVAELKTRPDLYSKLIVQPSNGGKGAAVRAGLAAAIGDYVLFQDADLEYDPSEYSKLLLPALKFNADVVIGSRFLAPTFTRVHYFFNKIGNRTITLLFNVFFNKTFTDIYSCYLMFRRSLIDPGALRTSGWDQQAEILAKCVKASSVHYEVPISYQGRTYEEGKKIRAYHVLSVIRTILAERFLHREVPSACPQRAFSSD